MLHVNVQSFSLCSVLSSFPLSPSGVIAQVGQDDDEFRSSEDIPDGMPCLSSDNNLKISAENWMDACIEENDCSESYM